MALVDEIELLNAQQLGQLVELANICQVFLGELMQRLKIQPLSYYPLTTDH